MATKAFLGHSFTSDDKELVGNVIEFLDAQKIAHRDFEWCHATQARATGVVDKVLPMIRGASIFIGLCTRKERVISPESLSPTFLNPQRLTVPAHKVGWKTSDWIIQEIGVAIALDLKIILLVESGVRIPGGLIGDLEYIQFDRTNLSTAFISLTQMLGDAVKGSSMSLGVRTSVDEKGNTEDSLQPTRVESAGHPQPQKTWTWDQFDHALLVSIVLKDAAYLRDVESAFKESDLANDQRMLRRWEASKEAWRILCDEGGDITRLGQLAGEDKKDTEILTLLANAQTQVGNQDIGARTHENAAAIAKDAGNLLSEAKSYFRAISTYIKCGSLSDAKRVLDYLLIVKSDSDAIELLKLDAMLEIAKHEKDQALQMVVLERKVQIKPIDEDVRFSLAYLYSESEDQESALLHYRAIPEAKRGSASWNNLGVAREFVKLNALAVEAYRESEKQGGTLAMSNTAKQYLSAGFVSEAAKLCEDTMKIADYDPAVLETLTTVKARRKDEVKQEDEIVLKAEPRSRFMRDAGRGLIESDQKVLPGQIKGPDCVLSVNQIGAHVSLVGSYESKSSALGFLIGEMVASPAKYEVKYELVLKGRTLFGTVSKKRLDKKVQPTLFSDDRPTPVVMIISEDQTSMRVMEGRGKSSKIVEIFV